MLILDYGLLPIYSLLDPHLSLHYKWFQHAWRCGCEDPSIRNSEIWNSVYGNVSISDCITGIMKIYKTIKSILATYSAWVVFVGLLANVYYIVWMSAHAAYSTYNACKCSSIVIKCVFKALNIILSFAAKKQKRSVMVSRSRKHSLIQYFYEYFTIHMLYQHLYFHLSSTIYHKRMKYSFIYTRMASHFRTFSWSATWKINWLHRNIFCNMLCMRNRQHVCMSSLLLCAYAMFCTVCRCALFSSTFCICCKCQRRRSYHPTQRVGILLNTFVHNIFSVSP